MKKYFVYMRYILCAGALVCAILIVFVKGEQLIADREMAELREQTERTAQTEVTDATGEEADEISFPAGLKAENDDLAAWLSVAGTVIDYPVMFTPDDEEYYLHRSFSKKYSLPGTPFMDKKCGAADEADSLIIYGHNMRDGTMFSALKNFEDEAFCKDNKTITLALPGGTREYTVFAVAKLDVRDKSDARIYDCAGKLSEQQFESYVSDIQERSLYNTGEAPAYGDRLIILSTCSYHTSDGRLIVAGYCRQGE